MESTHPLHSDLIECNLFSFTLNAIQSSPTSKQIAKPASVEMRMKLLSTIKLEPFAGGYDVKVEQHRLWKSRPGLLACLPLPPLLPPPALCYQSIMGDLILR